MGSLKWSISNAVFVREIDDEHKEIFEAISNVQRALGKGTALEIRALTQRLVSCVAGHFAHEERLMRAARYTSLPWHKQQHKAASKRVAQFVRLIDQGDAEAGPAMIEYLTTWLHRHTGIADRMMGAFLRNHQRCMWKVTLQASTKPLDACVWVGTNGEKFDPPSGENCS
jgi:hemerythrin